MPPVSHILSLALHSLRLSSRFVSGGSGHSRMACVPPPPSCIPCNFCSRKRSEACRGIAMQFPNDFRRPDLSVGVPEGHFWTPEVSPNVEKWSRGRRRRLGDDQEIAQRGLGAASQRSLARAPPRSGNHPGNRPGWSLVCLICVCLLSFFFLYYIILY